MHRLLALILCGLAVGLSAADDLFQYRLATQVPDKDGEKPARVLVWIPPAVERLRGALLCGQVLVEADVVRDARVRAACAEQGLAVIHVQTNLGSVSLDRLMLAISASTGYAELATAPVLPFGHSAGGGPALNVAIKHPDRAIGVVQYRGGMPDDTSALAKGTPTLAMMAQFDEFWGTMRNPDGTESWHRAFGYIAGFRAADPAGNLGAMVVEPGTGHFPWSDANAALLSQWIRSVAARRIPADGGPLVPLSATSGWVLGFDLRTPTVTPWTEWQGDISKTLWLPDEATARLAAAYHADLGKGLTDQFISWKDGTWVDAGVRHFFTKPTWVEGGATVRTAPAFRSTIPGRHDNQGPNWPGAGEPATDGGTPITVAIVAGAAVAGPGPTDVTLALNALYDNPSDRITFIARAPAGNGHRATEQVGMMPRGFKGLTGGAEQTLSFTAPESWSAAAGPLALGATSSQGLPVAYHVAYGPGRIVAGTLVVDQIPARAVLPMDLVVVASQMGRATPNPVRMAAPVARTIRISR